MREEARNPASNVLPSGISFEGLIAGIEESGYPLQSRVAAMLGKHIRVLEEWGYADDETKESRSLDLWAHQKLSHEGLVAPSLTMLMECKRSRHPLVFFRQAGSPRIPQFPAISGLPSHSVDLWKLPEKQAVRVTASEALQLQQLPFITEGPAVCRSFARAEPSGKSVKLDGIDLYRHLVLPLVKAMRHEVSRGRPPVRGETLWPTLVLPVAIIDGPMILVESPEKAADPVLTPWLRVVRHEATSVYGAQDRFYAIDVVHVDFLLEYWDKWVLPFAFEYTRRMEKVFEIFWGEAIVPDLYHWSWTDLVASNSR